MKISSPNIRLDSDGLKNVPAGQAGRLVGIDTMTFWKYRLPKGSIADEERR